MKKLKKYCFGLDLKNDPHLIEAYKKYHQEVWPEILKSIRDSGIEGLEIYNVSNRLFMIMEVNDTFNIEKKKLIDESDPVVQKWETLMWKYQQAIPGSKPGEKWLRMDKIFDLDCT